MASLVKPVYRRAVIFCASLLPLVWLVLVVVNRKLGPDPGSSVVTFTGEWALYFMFITLCITPLRRWLGWHWLATHRRMLGLFALFYAVLHVTGFPVFILGLDASRFITELFERPYITVGVPAFLILIVLGLTSTKAMMRRLGKRWLRLHQSLYPALVLAWLHVFWQVRSSYFESFVYGVIAVSLLAVRVYWWQRKRRKKPVKRRAPG